MIKVEPGVKVQGMKQSTVIYGGAAESSMSVWKEGVMDDRN